MNLQRRHESQAVLKWLGIHDIYVNSSIMDEGAPTEEEKPPTGLRAHSFQFDSTRLIWDL